MRGPDPILIRFALLFGVYGSFGCSRPRSAEPDGAEAPAPRAQVTETTTRTVSPTTASPTSCPRFGPVRALGENTNPRLNEASGLAASCRQAVLWTHNDSGDRARLFAIDAEAQVVWSGNLDGAAATDWEDIARAPGPDGVDRLYVADFGDNGRDRDSISIYIVQEPQLQDPPPSLAVEARLELRYPDGPHDAESLLVHPESLEIVIITKSFAGRSVVYRKPAPHVMGATTLQKVGTLQFGLGVLAGITLTTAGDFSPDGRWLAVRTYDDIFLWPSDSEFPLKSLLSEPPCLRLPVEQPQGESVTFACDGSGLLTLSERTDQPLLLFPVQPEHPY